MFGWFSEVFSTLHWCISLLKSDDDGGPQLASSGLGRKDSQRSLFSTWDALFSIPRPESREPGREPAHSVPARYRAILSALYSCGDYEKLVQGAFENFLIIKFRDTGLENVVKGLEWFVHFDRLQSAVQHSQVYTLMGHFVFPLVAAHLLFAASTRQRVVFPVAGSEAAAARTRRVQVVAALLAEMPPAGRVFRQNEKHCLTKECERNYYFLM